MSRIRLRENRKSLDLPRGEIDKRSVKPLERKGVPNGKTQSRVRGLNLEWEESLSAAARPLRVNNVGPKG